MAYQNRPSTKPAAGNAPNTGAPGPTPSPTRPLPPGEFSPNRTAADRGNAYGENQSWAPPVLRPGQRSTSAGVNIAPPDGDPVLERVINRGLGPRDDREPDDQIRQIAAGNVPNAWGQRDANKGGAPAGSVPDKTDASATANPIRKPGR